MKNEKDLSREENYIAPAIDVIEMEIEQHILAGSGSLPDMDSENW